MTFDTNWDVNNYKYEHELEHHWELKRGFIEAHKQKFPEAKLISLAQTFYNIEVLGCRYDGKVMQRVKAMAEAFAPSGSTRGHQPKITRTFVPASNAASERVKARLGVVVENSGRIEAKKPMEWVAAKRPQERDGGPVPKRPVIGFPEVNRPVMEGARRAAWLNRVDPKTVASSGPFGRLVLFEWNQDGCDSPISVIERAASASHMTTSFNFVQNSEGVCCQFSLDNLFLSSGSGATQKLSKDAACRQAIERLKQTCFTIQVKAAFVSDGSQVGRSLEREQQSEGTSMDKPLPQDNIGAKMLRLMGWGGGGLGKEGQGQEEPVKPDERATHISRAGLGGNAGLGEFRRKARQLLEDFASSDSSSDLVFSPDLSKDERKALHEMVRRYNLKSRSYGKGDDVRHIVVFKKISPMEIVEELVEAGGQTDKYLLLPPSSYLQ